MRGKASERPSGWKEGEGAGAMAAAVSPSSSKQWHPNDATRSHKGREYKRRASDGKFFDDSGCAWEDREYKFDENNRKYTRKLFREDGTFDGCHYDTNGVEYYKRVMALFMMRSEVNEVLSVHDSDSEPEADPGPILITEQTNGTKTEVIDIEATARPRASQEYGKRDQAGANGSGAPRKPSPPPRAEVSIISLSSEMSARDESEAPAKEEPEAQSKVTQSTTGLLDEVLKRMPKRDSNRPQEDIVAQIVMTAIKDSLPENGIQAATQNQADVPKQAPVAVEEEKVLAPPPTAAVEADEQPSDHQKRTGTLLEAAKQKEKVGTSMVLHVQGSGLDLEINLTPSEEGGMDDIEAEIETAMAEQPTHSAGEAQQATLPPIKEHPVQGLGERELRARNGAEQAKEKQPAPAPKAKSDAPSESQMTDVKTVNTFSTRGTKATNSQRHESITLNRTRLKADLQSWHDEYKSASAKYQRNNTRICEIESNKAAVAEVVKLRENRRKFFLENYQNSSSLNPGGLDQKKLAVKLESCAKKAGVPGLLSTPPKPAFVRYKISERAEIPRATSWIMMKKNVITTLEDQNAFLPWLGDENREVPDAFFNFEGKHYYPNLDETQTLKFLALKVAEEHGTKKDVQDYFYQWIEANVTTDWDADLIPTIVTKVMPDLLLLAKDEGSSRHTSHIESFFKFRHFYCKRCHMFNCLVHANVGSDEGCEYEREDIIENGYFIDKDLPKKCTPAPLKPKEPCGSDCCYHIWKPEDELAVENGGEGQVASKPNSAKNSGASACTNQSNSSCILDGVGFDWKSQCTILASIYEGDCCKVAQILSIPCWAVYNYLKHKRKHEERVTKLDFNAKRKAKQKAKQKRKKRKKNVKQFLEPEEDYCKYRIEGCHCKAKGGHCKTNACPCKARGSECDPDICQCEGCKTNNCGPTGCCNRMKQTWNHKKTLVAKSDVSGWGLFLKDGAKKGEFICEYTGERIASGEADRRGSLYSNTGITFLFDLVDSTSDEYPTIDALRLGCKSKFINHPPTYKGIEANCEPKKTMVLGDVKVGFYAKRDIQPYEELFFDYDFNNPGSMDWYNNLKAKEEENKKKRKKPQAKGGPGRKQARSLPRKRRKNQVARKSY